MSGAMTMGAGAAGVGQQAGRRGHRRTVPGVTNRCTRSLAGRNRTSAARTARSAQPGQGRGIVRAQHGDLVPQHEQPGVREGR